PHDRASGTDRHGSGRRCPREQRPGVQSRRPGRVRLPTAGGIRDDAHAAGGVGLLLCQWARALGARVVGTVSSEAKAELARANGCEHPIVTRTYSFAERTRQVSGGRGADVIYDGLGREAAQENLAALATRGHWVSYGQATGAPDPMNLSEKSATLSQPVLFHYTLEYLHQMAGHVFAALRDGILKPEVRRYPLTAAADAHRDLEA